MYDIMTPGPTQVRGNVLAARALPCTNPDLDPDFFTFYKETCELISSLLHTGNQTLILDGEGILGLEAACASLTEPGDRVLVLSTGLFGSGMADMARAIGCEARTVEYGYDETLKDFGRIEEAIREFRPKMITMVQNETPSGTMNPVAEVGELKVKYGVPLLYVDAVSGIGGSDVRTDEWHVDFCLGGSQKCLSAPASMSFLAVSEEAWGIVEEVGYAGYDALLPFRTAVRDAYFPYTPYWQGTAQLYKACRLLLEEGLEHVVARHERVAAYCRERVREMGLRLYPAEGAVASPTVTAVYVPEGMAWKELDARLRQEGVAMGGNYGCLAGKVFRIGHMGTQANLNRVKEALDVLEVAVRR